MAPSQDQTAALRERLCQGLLDQLTDALIKYQPVDRGESPILRVEAFIEDGRESSQSERIISVRYDDRGFKNSYWTREFHVAFNTC